MRPIAVLPNDALPRVAALLAAAGWKAAPPPTPEEGDGQPRKVLRHGDPVLSVSENAKAPETLHRIVVLHAGTRRDRAAMDAAQDAAASSGAEIVVLHVPRSSPARGAASMPFRIADHGSHDWAEWQEEFERRFCRSSRGVAIRLRITPGATATLPEQVNRERPDLVIVSASSHGADDADQTVRAIQDLAIPVLVVPAVGHDRVVVARAH